jgi:putative peptidoglycan lipid II flippase
MSAERASRRGAWAATAGIVASRLAGFVRQAVLAHFLGAGAVADAVVAAFRLGNVAQNLVGEGAISAALVPEYVRAREESPVAAAELARGALGVLLLAVLGLSAAGVALADPLTRIFAAGLEGEGRRLAVELTRVAFPMTGLLVLSAWALAILTAHRRFLLAYTAPVAWSAAQIAAIGGAALLGLGDAVALAHALMSGAVVGALFQLALLAWPARRLLGSLRPTLPLSDERLRRTLRRVPSTILGRGVLQLSGLVDTSLVTLLGAGALASFQYAQTAYLLPMAILGTGEAAALLPSLASAADKRPLAETIGPALRRVAVLGGAASGVFVALSPEIVAVLFERGAFTDATTAKVAPVLSVYGIGLLANALGRMMSTACFAAGDTGSPARYAVVRVVVSTAGSLALMGPLGVRGVVAGAVAGGVVEATLLARRVRAHFGETGLRAVPWLRLGGSVVVTATAGLAMRALLEGTSLSLGPLLRGLAVLGPAGLVWLATVQALALLDLRALVRRVARRPAG